MDKLTVDRKWVQWLASLTATLVLFTSGMQFSWPSPALEKLESEDLFHLTNEAISWTVSLLSVGAIFGSVACGCIMNTIGRKWCIIVTNAPFIVGWVLIYFSTSAAWLYAGSIIAGAATGMSQCAVPVYVGEIGSIETRGALVTLSSVMINFGVLFEYVCGPFVTYRSLAAISCIPSVVCAVCMLFVPESPTFLLAKDRELEARASLQSLRGLCTDKEIAAVKKDISKQKPSVEWYKALDSGAWKPLLIVSFLGFMQQVSGNAVILAYFDEIYLEANSSLDKLYADIVVSVLAVTTALLSSLTVEKSGRRPLFLLSSLLEAAGYFMLACYFFFKDYEMIKRVTWMPLFLIAIIVASYNIGHGPLVYVLVGEILPHDVRAIGSTSAVVCISIGAFVSTKIYPLTEPYTAFGSFGILVLLSAVFFYIMVPETKGKTMEEIREVMINSTRKSNEKSCC